MRNAAVAGDGHGLAPDVHVLHVIIGLDAGGAELMLSRLVEADRAGGTCRHSVVSLTTCGVVGNRLHEGGVEVRSLELKSAFGAPRALWRLVQLLRSSSPDVVQTWMYHADFIGGLAARLAGIGNVVWGIRSSTPLRRWSLTFMLARMCAFFSSTIPAVISCNSEKGRDAHVALGYDRHKIIVVPNGCDTARFSNSPALRQSARAALGFSCEHVVVGTIGRFDPHKDLATFVRAAAEVARGNNRVRILMVGKDLDAANGPLLEMIRDTGQLDRFVLAGQRADPVSCYAALDVFCLSSIREGFPNAVIEAMAMEVPCVVTRAGDAPEIIGTSGEAVATQDPSALAAAIGRMVDMTADDRASRGRMARARVEERFSMALASARFHALYAQLVVPTAASYEGVRPEA